MNSSEILALKKRYPAGTRIMLDSMDDPFAPIEISTVGTVVDVDDAGTIHMKWDNGRGLGICPEVDRFHVVKEVD